MTVKFAYKDTEYLNAVALSKALPMMTSVLVQWSEDADWMAANAAALCYDTNLSNADGSRKEKMANRIEESCRDSGHNTTLEHNIFSFLKKVPIFVARQDLRARHASFDERSLRYCRADDGSLIYYTPPELLKPERMVELYEWEKQHERAIQLYSHLTDAEILEGEEARSILPVGIATTYIDSRNGWAWRHHAQKRLCLRAQTPIRMIRRQEVNQLIKVAPVMFGDLNMPCYMACGCSEVKKCDVIKLDETGRYAQSYLNKREREGK